MPTPIENSDRVTLTAEEFDAMMAPGDRVHTFQGINGILLGCDVDRERLLDYAREGRVELAGPTATAMRHGVVLFHADLARDTYCATV